MILTEAELRAYIPTSTLAYTYLDKHEKRAMLKHFPKYLGTDLTKALLIENPSAENSALIEELKGAIANLAYLEAVPFIDVVSTNTGFGVISNQNIAPASKARVDAFKDAALNAANDYLNDALLFLETNIADYPTWNKSSLIEGGVIASIDDWPQELEINYSRIEFVNLVPFIRRQEKLWLSKKLSAEFVASIAGTADLDVLPDMKKALAFMAFYEMEKEAQRHNKDVVLDSAIQYRATEYLNSCIDFLNGNLEVYPIYQQYAYEEKFSNDLDDDERGIFVAG